MVSLKNLLSFFTKRLLKLRVCGGVLLILAQDERRRMLMI